MKTKINSVIFTVSLILNCVFILFLVFSAFSKTSFLTYYSPHSDDYFISAAVAALPKDSHVLFNAMEFNLRPGQKCFIQFSVVSDGRQGNFLINALYDPDIVSVSSSPGYGIEITALSPGATLLQSINVNGITDIALVSVYE